MTEEQWCFDVTRHRWVNIIIIIIIYTCNGCVLYIGLFLWSISHNWVYYTFIINYKLVYPKLIDCFLILCEMLFLLVNSIIIELQPSICWAVTYFETCGKIFNNIKLYYCLLVEENLIETYCGNKINVINEIKI